MSMRFDEVIANVAIALFLLGMVVCTSEVKAQPSRDVQFAIETIYSLCVGAGRSDNVLVSSSQAGTALDVQTVDNAGRTGGQATISKSQAHGLVAGLDNRLLEFSQDAVTGLLWLAMSSLLWLLAFLYGRERYWRHGRRLSGPRS